MSCSFLSLVIFYSILHFPHLFPHGFAVCLHYGLHLINLAAFWMYYSSWCLVYLSFNILHRLWFVFLLIYSSALSFLPSKSWHFLIQIRSCKKNPAIIIEKVYRLLSWFKKGKPALKLLMLKAFEPNWRSLDVWLQRSKKLKIPFISVQFLVVFWSYPCNFLNIICKSLLIAFS